MTWMFSIFHYYGQNLENKIHFEILPPEGYGLQMPPNSLKKAFQRPQNSTKSSKNGITHVRGGKWLFKLYVLLKLPNTAASKVPSLQFGDLTNEADGRSVLWLSLYGITFIVSTCSITLGLEPTPSWSITQCFQPMTTRSHHTIISTRADWLSNGSMAGLHGWFLFWFYF